MPCFKGLAVSIHTPDGPLPEYSIQKQSRQSRIISYIPVPPPKISSSNDETKTEQSTFAISITLLVQNQRVPYSGRHDDPNASWRYVGGALPDYTSQRGKYTPVVGPYIALTTSLSETVAAYIHFDGRAKEEVATLLRRGEETWVNSRWVSVPHSEGGGLAEREFLFREVGLERWLNGLDLKGETKDVAGKIERRKQRLHKRQERKQEVKEEIKMEDDDDWDTPRPRRSSAFGRENVLRYGGDAQLENVSADESMLSSDTESDDDMPMPEAAGQIKVSLYRVHASGEVKKGEYSPQFDAHDDDDDKGKGGGAGDADIDHTTTFAKPKSLDPKTISTQTVTGIDAPNTPYATFTFFYRGEKQLQKMGIIPTSKTADTKSTDSKPKSRQVDFSKLGPLKASTGAAFSGYRDTKASAAFEKVKKGNVKDPDDMDSDADDEDDSEKQPNGPAKGAEEKQENTDVKLSQEELRRRAELAEGVKKMQLKRQHSAEAMSKPAPSVSTSTAAAHTNSTTNASAEPANPSSSTPAATSFDSVRPLSSGHPLPSVPPPTPTDPSVQFGSPFKKARASVSNGEQLGPSPLSQFNPLEPQGGGDVAPVGRSSSEEVHPSSSMSANGTKEDDEKPTNGSSSAPDTQMDHHFKSRGDEDM
ncbi:MAG: hypothetical protein M1828_003290 [Chrysothrix sp. TS-e1954]|nr:MAG: hypothetical protein M1828_003290 [Chrysothrix sp. TS-e1954]